METLIKIKFLRGSKYINKQTNRLWRNKKSSPLRAVLPSTQGKEKITILQAEFHSAFFVPKSKTAFGEGLNSFTCMCVRTRARWSISLTI